MHKIELKDVLNMAVKNLPSTQVQEAMLVEIKRLQAQGLSEEMAVSLLFNTNPTGQKQH